MPLATIRNAVRILLAFGLTATTVFSQSTGELTGVVSDPTAASVPAARLLLKDVERNTTLTGETSTAGLFRFTGLTPGRYSLNVSAAGFNAANVSGIVIEVNRVTRVDVPMVLAGATATVEVSGQAAALDVESGTKGVVMNVERARDLPLASRNPLELTTLTPGVIAPIPNTGADPAVRQGNDSTAATSSYSVNGGIRTANGGFLEVVVDGVSVTSQREGVIQALPSADSLQEFRVQSGGMGPEVGRTVGGVINYVTRSGTNEFHGNLFWDNRNTATTARRALPAVGDKPINNFNQYGGTFGGPLRVPKVYNGRNRTFFFFGFEGSRWLRNNPTLDNVPTLKMRTGDFSELATVVYDPLSATNPAQRTAFPGNRIPTARFNAIGQSMVNAFPLPTRPGTDSNFDGHFHVLTPVDDYTGRIDHSISQKQRLMGRITWVESINNQGWNLGPNDGRTGVSNIPSRNLALNYAYTITPQLLYTSAGGFTWFHRTFNDPTGNTAGAGFFNYSVTPAPPTQAQNIRPIVTFDIYRGVGGNAVEDQLAETWQWNQTLSWVKGNHTLRAGTDLRWFIAGGSLTVDAPTGAFGFNSLQTSQGTATSGSSIASALLGLTNTATFGQPPPLRVKKAAPSFFVADDWRVTRNLTLNLGLRFDDEGGLVEEKDQIGYMDTTTVNSIVGRPGVFRYANVDGAPRSIAASKFSVSPRIGLAWSPKAIKGLAVRGAFGVYNAPVPMVGPYGAAAGFEPLLQYVKPTATDPAVALQSSYALPPSSGPLGPSAYLGQSVSQVLNRQLNPARIYQWNFGLQKELPRGMVLEALYTGNRGTHLLETFNIDIPPASVTQSAIDLTTSTGNPSAALNYLNQLVPNPVAGKVPGTLGNPTVSLSRAATPYPQFNTIAPIFNTKDSIYHALQATLQKRLSRHFTFLFSYTYSKLLTDLINQQNPYDFRNSRGLDATDRTHMVSTSWLYELPFGKGQAFARSGWQSKLFGGFHLNQVMRVQSGPPLMITQSSNGLGLTGSRPDVAGDATARSQAIRGRVAANGNVVWLDPASYQIVNGRFGTAPATDSHLRGPGYWQLDLGLSRDFRIMEHAQLRFHAQTFNAFNHTNPIGVDANRNSGTFGQISAVTDPRVFQFGLEIRF